MTRPSEGWLGEKIPVKPTPEPVGLKWVSRRDLFADLVEGVAALAGAREAKRKMTKKRSRSSVARNASPRPRGNGRDSRPGLRDSRFANNI